MELAYRISVAVAGFTDADLSIETKENRLAIRGEKQTNDEERGALPGHRRANLRA
jgi:molecular chaperone IbpA